MKQDTEGPFLSEEHLAFAERIRGLLVGATLQSVGYQGLEFPSDGTLSDALAKDCETVYSEIDRLDHSLILRTDRGSLYVTWDGTFYPYGLNVLTDDPTTAYSATLEASTKPIWADLLGSPIDVVELEWDELTVTSLETSATKSYLIPIWMRFLVKNTWVFVGAADLLRDDRVATMFMDNLLVTTNTELAKDILHFPARRF